MLLYNTCLLSDYSCLYEKLNIPYLTNTYQLACLSPYYSLERSTLGFDSAYLKIRLESRQTFTCIDKQNCKVKFSEESSPWIYKVQPNNFITGSVIKFYIRHKKGIKDIIDNIVNLKVI